MKSAVYFFLGLVFGAAGGAYVAKSIAERNVEEQIEKATIEARDYYKEKYEKKEKEQEEVKEKAEKAFIRYNRFSEGPVIEEPPTAYSNIEDIDQETFEEADGYYQCFLNFYSDKVLTDEEGNIVDNPEEMVGNYTKELDPANDKIYVRNDSTKTKYEVTYMDTPFDEFAEDE